MPALLRFPTVALLSCATLACGNAESSVEAEPEPHRDAAVTDAGSDAGTRVARDASIPKDAALAKPDASQPVGKSVVYAHSASQLFELDPTTKAITSTRPFVGCTGFLSLPDSVTDIAIDGEGHAMCTTASGLFTLDLATARCTLVKADAYPNSLSFVPKGTLDAEHEVLVGYVGSTYVRIDTASGVLEEIGEIGSGFISSGDIVSVQGGGTFLTVQGSGCSDCLLQVNPATGALVQNYGPIQHSNVFGLAYWAGAVYGFDSAGTMFEIRAAGKSVAVIDLPPEAGATMRSFWGAGSSTSAPPTGDDGSSIPLI